MFPSKLAAYILLPEGDLQFNRTNFERGRFNGGQKVLHVISAITVQVVAKEGTTSVKFELILYRTLECVLSHSVKYRSNETW
jgi:hypothetical protein